VQSINKTAVLVFAESVEVHANRKALLTSKQDNHRLLQELTHHSLSVAQRSGLDFYHFSETHQIGDSFSERLSNSLEEIYGLGYEKAVVIGSDCPDLTEKDILKASSHLQTSDMVIGPDLRGGIFLLGLDKGSFQKDLFEALHWQTNDLRKSFFSYARTLSIQVSWLNKKADFNASEDLDSYWWVSKEIRSVLAGMANKIVHCFESLYGHYSFLLELTCQRRGPPYILA